MESSFHSIPSSGLAVQPFYDDIRASPHPAFGRKTTIGQRFLNDALYYFRSFLELHFTELCAGGFDLFSHCFLALLALIALSIFAASLTSHVARRRTHCGRNESCVAGVAPLEILLRLLPACLSPCRLQSASRLPDLTLQHWKRLIHLIYPLSRPLHRPEPRDIHSH